MKATGRGHPIDPFLAVWASRGGRDGFDLRLRVYRALSAEGPWALPRLRVTLRALVAFTPDEQRRFDLCFREFFRDQETPPWLRERLDSTLDREVALAELATLTAPPSQPPPPPRSQPQLPPIQPPVSWRRWAAVIAQVALGLAVCAALTFVGYTLWNAPPPTPPVDAGLPGDAAPPPDSGPSIEEVETRIVQDPPVLAQHTTASSELVKFRALMAILLVLALLTAGDMAARAWRHRPITLPALPPVPPLNDRSVAERQLNLRSASALEPPLDGAALDRAALRTGFALDPALPELDLRETVFRTARAAGLLEPAWQAGRRPPVLRVCRPASLDPVATAVLDTFVAGLRARGVTVSSCIDAPDEAPVDLSLVVLDASRWSVRHQEAWRREAHVAYLEARDPGRWDAMVLRLPFGVFPLDEDGLAAAIDAARTEHLPPGIETVPEGDAIQRLGGAFALAAACAFAETFDLATADALRRQITPDVGFLAIQRVLALHGVTGGPSQWTMSPALRAWFDERVPHGSPLREAALEAQEARLRQLPPPPKGSRAEQLLAMQSLWLTWHRGFADVAALDRWMTEAERFLDDPVLQEILRAQQRRQPPTPLPETDDLRRRKRMARLGLGEAPVERPLSPATWGLLAVAGLSSVTLAALTARDLARSRGWSVRIRSGPSSDAVGSGTPFGYARCPGVSVMTDFGAAGAPGCRALERPRAGDVGPVRLGAPQPSVGIGNTPPRLPRVDRAVSCEPGAAVVGVEGQFAYAASTPSQGM